MNSLKLSSRLLRVLLKLALGLLLVAIASKVVYDIFSSSSLATIVLVAGSILALVLCWIGFFSERLVLCYDKPVKDTESFSRGRSFLLNVSSFGDRFGFIIPSDECPIFPREASKKQSENPHMTEATKMKSALELLRENLKSSPGGLVRGDDLISDLDRFIEDLSKAEQAEARCAFLLYRGFGVDMRLMDKLGVYV